MTHDPLLNTYFFRKSLTKDEVLAGLSEVGGLQLDCVDMKASNMADFLIVATGKSPLHLRKMADMLVQTVRIFPVLT